MKTKYLVSLMPLLIDSFYKLMFKQNIRRIGFACKYIHPDQSLKPKCLKDIQSQFAETTTTDAWMKRQTSDQAEERLWAIIQHNVQAAYNLVQYVSKLQRELHMLRIGSSQLPFYTHPDWRYFYQRTQVINFLERQFARIGQLAKEKDVRLSMHPGQYCVIGSDQSDIVERSLEELEYHADLIRWMGYGQKFQDFKCNVHLSGRKGAIGFLEAKPQMSI